VPNPYYRTGDSLKAKNLRAGGMTIGFPAHAIGLLDLDPNRTRTALDAGCGWGRFAVPLLQHAPHLDLTVSDVWPGMVTTCTRTLEENDLRASALVADVTRAAVRRRHVRPRARVSHALRARRPDHGDP